MTDTDIGYAVLNWWKDLTGRQNDSDGVLKKTNSGRTAERAELRRCKSPEHVIGLKGYHRLRSYIANDSINPEALAVVAGLCSHIREHDSINEFPLLLAKAEQGKTTPPLSESRFKKLVTSRTTTEFYTGLRRALKLTNNIGNILSLTKGVMLWYRAKSNPVLNVQDSMLFQWSKDYYDQLLKNENKNN